MSDPDPTRNQTPSSDPGQPQSYSSAPDPQGYQQPVHLPAGPAGGYGQPYGALPEHPQGTAILVLGIVGLFVTICAPIAWYLGSKAQKEIAASGFHYSNEQNITVGKIIGMVVTILAIIGIVIGIIVTVVVVIIGVSQSG